jgi:hypothetical protein
MQTSRKTSFDWDSTLRPLEEHGDSSSSSDDEDKAEQTTDDATELNTTLRKQKPIVEKKRPMRDKYHIAYSLFFLLGCGSIIPSHAFLMSVDFFNQMFPAHVRQCFMLT